MDSDNFIFYIKTKDIYADIAKRCSNYETDRPLPKATDKTAIPLMKRWIRGNNNVRICCIKTKSI